MTSPEPFGGTIGRTFKDSEPWWPPPPPAADGKTPNVVIILFDDTGFAHLGCYGSTIETPNIDALAAGGLRYSNFHTTAICSPTRASLLTGRNHHSVGLSTIANFDNGYPNTRGALTRHATTLAEILREQGYGTYCVGKWHLVRSEQTSGAGPVGDWPLQRGFDRYYGFLAGATHQFYPELTYDNHHVEPPALPEDGYHVSEDLVDRSIDFVRDGKSIYPDRPFFLYLAFGATHSPHHAPAEYVEKYRGRFDAGWDAVRQDWYERQLDLGVIPAETELAPRNPGVEAWDDLPEDVQRYSLRLQEAFAGSLDHTDAQIGRIVDFLEAAGELDNTIFLLMSDNGSAPGGGPDGTSFPGHRLEEILPRLDEIGGPTSAPAIPWGWSQVGNTPLKWYKQNTFGGGIRDPLIVHWPAHIQDPGGARHQFHHVSDVVPTVLELLDLQAPNTYRGYAQMPVSGTSFAYTLDEADGPSRKPVQHFELAGDRGIWRDGWKAVTHHVRGEPYSDDEWELYHLDEDFSEIHNVATEHPELLRELIDLWWIEAGRYGVLPLDDRKTFGPTGVIPAAPRHDLARKRPDAIQQRQSYRYTPPISQIPAQAAAPMGGSQWLVTAEIERRDTSAEGVLLARGRGSGLSFWLQDNRLHCEYRASTTPTVVHSEAEVPVGETVVGARLEGSKAGVPGRLSLLIDGAEVGEAEIPRISRAVGNAPADVGLDRPAAVSDSYEAPFAFSGTLHAVNIELTPFPDQSDDEEARIRYEQQEIDQ